MSLGSENFRIGMIISVDRVKSDMILYVDYLIWQSFPIDMSNDEISGTGYATKKTIQCTDICTGVTHRTANS